MHLNERYPFSTEIWLNIFVTAILFSMVMQSVSQEAHPSQDAFLQLYLQSYIMAVFTDNKVQRL